MHVEQYAHCGTHQEHVFAVVKCVEDAPVRPSGVQQCRERAGAAADEQYELEHIAK